MHANFRLSATETSYCLESLPDWAIVGHTELLTGTKVDELLEPHGRMSS